MRYNGNIYWFLRGSKNTPSSRIHGLNIHRYLVKKKYRSYLVCSPANWLPDMPISKDDLIQFTNKLSSTDIVIIQKFEGERTINFIDSVKKSNAKVIYIDCDYPLKLNEVEKVDYLICPSDFLANLYDKAGCKNIKVIPDAVETFIEPQVISNFTRKRHCVWFGQNCESKWKDINYLYQNLQSNTRLSHWSFITISNSPKATYQWSNKNSYKQISLANAVVLPVLKTNDHSYSKSAVRAIQAMAVGVPVLASPIPAYTSIIKNGINGFICKQNEDWAEALKILEDPEEAFNISREAYLLAKSNYSIEVIGEKWEAMLANFIADKEDYKSKNYANYFSYIIYKNLSKVNINRLSVIYLFKAFRAYINYKIKNGNSK